jgi:hypothetical protein
MRRKREVRNWRRWMEILVLEGETDVDRESRF